MIIPQIDFSGIDTRDFIPEPGEPLRLPDGTILQTVDRLDILNSTLIEMIGRIRDDKRSVDERAATVMETLRIFVPAITEAQVETLTPRQFHGIFNYLVFGIKPKPKDAETSDGDSPLVQTAETPVQ